LPFVATTEYMYFNLAEIPRQVLSSLNTDLYLHYMIDTRQIQHGLNIPYIRT